VAEESPLLLVVDDLQWVDKHSRAALSHLARTVGEEPVMMLFTCRTGEGDPEVAKALDSLARLPGTDPVELGPLEASEVAELLVLLLEPLEPESLHELAGRVYDITRGNPLFMVEILKLLQSEGLMEVGSGGKWRVSPACLEGPLPVPKTVESAIRRHLDDLDGVARYLAAHLAREARPLPVEELGRLARLNPFEVSEGLRQLFERDLIRRNPDGRLQFVHDAVEEAARRYLRADGRGVGLGQESGDWPASKARRRWRSLDWWRSREGMSVAGVGAVALVAAALGLWQGGGGLIDRLHAAPEPTYPYGHGRFFVRTGDGARWVTPPSREGEEWTATEAELPFPHEVLRGPIRTTDGSLHWFVHSSDGPEDPPFVGYPLSDGGVRPLLKVAGDAGFFDLSPTGRYALIMRQNLEVMHYAHDLVSMDLATGHIQTLFRAQEMLGGAAWSPDGRRVALVERGQWDSLRILTPDGTVLASFGLPDSPHLSSPSWCEDSERLVVQAVVDGVPTVGVLHAATGSHTFFPLLVPGLGSSKCVGGGSGVAAAGFLEGESRFVFLDLEQETISTIPGLSGAPIGAFWWVPERVAPVVQSLTIQGGDQQLEVGGKTRFTALARFTDGDERPVGVSWISGDPSVAWVDSTGLVIANHPGTIPVVARYADWLEDSVQVNVMAGDHAEVLFRDDFSSGDLRGWQMFGHPPAEVVEREGERVLSLPGDGRYSDGVAAHQTFSLSAGATLELQFQLPLTQRVWQKLVLCMEPCGGLAEPPPRDWRGAYLHGSICIRYPGDENVKFDRREARVIFNGFGHWELFTLPEDMDPSDWVHLALQIRPDGTVTTWVNHSYAHEARARLPIAEGSLWRVYLSGASVDTHLHVRSVTVWPGQRY
jgi:hypothetical protein